MKKRFGFKQVLWVCGGIAGFAVLAIACWLWHFRTYTPAEVLLDVRAGIAARNAPRPVERFLELRYGPLTDPANRQKAFIDFFNIGHIQGMHLLVNRMPESRRQESIYGMAQWIAEYRRTMTLPEKEALAAYIRSGEGRVAIEQATGQYLSHDVRYRAATAPVIAELMATLDSINKP